MSEEMDSVWKIIDNMIEQCQSIRLDGDALDKSYCDCSIATLKLLKDRLRVIDDV